jgi:hypothetical protein
MRTDQDAVAHAGQDVARAREMTAFSMMMQPAPISDRAAIGSNDRQGRVGGGSANRFRQACSMR